MPQFRTRQEENDYNLATKFLDKLRRGENLTDDEKVVTGIIARRAPGEFGRQALALYNHLMTQG
jgi:hypothetical protein